MMKLLKATLPYMLCSLVFFQVGFYLALYLESKNAERIQQSDRAKIESGWHYVDGLPSPVPPEPGTNWDDIEWKARNETW